jgi:endonuclease-3 related protein
MAGSSRLQDLYQTLYDYFGPPRWWPGDTTLEILVGAVLTQNTNWRNVSLALAHLKQEQLLSLDGLMALPVAQLAEMIRPAG